MRVRHLLLVSTVLFSLPLAAQDGSALYKARCAACHDNPKARVPPLSAIKTLSVDAVYAALKNGTMQSQAQGLSSAQLSALVGYLAPSGAAEVAPVLTRTCKRETPLPGGEDSPVWNGWSTSETNSRFQSGAAAGIAPEQIKRLKLKWAFNLGSVTYARAVPSIVGGRLFIVTASRIVYSLDAATGCTYWGFKADEGLRSGVTVGAGRVYFGDQRATVYALDARSGKLLWKVRPVDHVAAGVTAIPRYYRGVLYQPFSSDEEVRGAGPNYECCTFRGTVVALDAATGHRVWETPTIAEKSHPTGTAKGGAQAYGPSGAGIWSTPTIDRELGLLYVATGDNYSDPPTPTSDAVLALDLKTGSLRWTRQLTENDAYTVGCATAERMHCPKVPGPDFDFGQPPILVRLAGGHRALVIAQKSGIAHALDPDREGEVLWHTRVGEGSALGGSEWGSAADGEKLYVAISDIVLKAGAPDPKSLLGVRFSLDPSKGGGLHALDLKTGKILWSAHAAHCAEDRTDCSPALSAAVTVIPGAVFSGSVDGHLRAHSTRTGEVLWDFDTERSFDTVNAGPAHGGSLDGAGPAVVGGRVFVSAGCGVWGGVPGNVLLALSVDGK